MTNHYPDIRSKLNEFVGLSLDMGNKKHNLLEKIKKNLSITFDSLKPDDFQKVNPEAVNKVAERILSYDRSFLRITDYGKTRILYYCEIDLRIPFSGLNYDIFSSALVDEETNVKRVNEVKSSLAEAIDKIIEQVANELNSYNDSKRAFTNERNTLLNRLLRVKYGTKLNFEKQNMRKKCSLV
jgi:hypothetical protein